MKWRTTTTILAFLGVSLVLAPILASNCTGQSAHDSADVLCFMDPSNTAFKERLSLDSRITLSYVYNSTYGNFTSNLADFDAYVVCGFLPNNTTFVEALVSNITTNGKGLFMWGGEYPVLQNSNPACIAFKNLLPVKFNEPLTFPTDLYIDQGGITSITITKDTDVSYNELDPSGPGLLHRDIDWTSCPQVKERLTCNDALVMTRGASVLAYKAEAGRTSPAFEYTKGEPLIAFRAENSARILWISLCPGYIKPSFTATVDANKPFYLWPFFNYLLYQSIMYVSGLNATDIDTYDAWPLSPIPHPAVSAGPWVFILISIGVGVAVVAKRASITKTATVQ